MNPIKAHDAVLIRDASGRIHAATALTAIEPTYCDGKKIHDFPVIWVEETGDDGSTFRAPWPAADVTLMGDRS